MPSQPPPELQEPSKDTPLASAVFQLGESQKRFLGPLPFAAWNEAFDQGHVLAALRAGRLCGYVMFRTPRNEVVIAHLAVHPEFRGTGVARDLLTALRHRYADRQGIRARCRRDYPANGFWPAYGFIAQANLPGRGADGQELTLWWLDHGHRDLTSWPGQTPGRLPALIDANVFIDLHGSPPKAEGTRTREALARIADEVELLVAPETSNELNRNKSAAERERLLAIATARYPRLSYLPEDFRRAENALLSRLSREPRTQRDASDLRQVAAAIAADIPIVVTRDQGARERLGPAAWETAQVVVTSPEELVAITFAGDDPNAYAPGALEGTALTIAEVAPTDVRHLTAFLSTGTGERRSDFEQLVARVAAHAPNSYRQVVRDADNQAIAAVGAVAHDDYLEVPWIRVGAGAFRPTLASQLVSGLRVLAQTQSRHVVRVTDKHLAPTVVGALRQDGYRPVGEHWVAFTLAGTVTSTEAHSALARLATHDLGAAVTELLDASTARTHEAAATLEHDLRPCRIVDSDLPTWLVSIQPQYSDDLFGYPESLLVRPTTLGLNLEHVYYRGGTSGETAPGRILWRLSGKNHGGIFACSSLVEVLDAHPGALHRKFRRLGVWDLGQVQTRAGGRSTTRALRVRDTQLFRSPVLLRELRDIATAYDQPLQLQSPCRVKAEVFEAIMRASERG